MRRLRLSELSDLDPNGEAYFRFLERLMSGEPVQFRGVSFQLNGAHEIIARMTVIENPADLSDTDLSRRLDKISAAFDYLYHCQPRFSDIVGTRTLREELLASLSDGECAVVCRRAGDQMHRVGDLRAV